MKKKQQIIGWETDSGFIFFGQGPGGSDEFVPFGDANRDQQPKTFNDQIQELKNWAKKHVKKKR